MTSEVKYTDRDVRDNKSQVIEIVTDFLEDYTGEFQFLIDCKMRQAQGIELSVGMMRGVLNCMRADPRINIELPDPLPVEEHNVVPIRKSQRKWGPSVCDVEGDHCGHYIGDEKEFARRHYCSGWYAINRSRYVLPGKIRSPWAGIVARTGAMIHRLNGDVQVIWYPNSHKEGFYAPPDIAYETCCKGASVIRGGYLLTQENVNRLLIDRTVLDNYIFLKESRIPPPSQRQKLVRCPRCWD